MKIIQVPPRELPQIPNWALLEMGIPDYALKVVSESVSKPRVKFFPSFTNNDDVKFFIQCLLGICEQDLYEGHYIVLNSKFYNPEPIDPPTLRKLKDAIEKQCDFLSKHQSKRAIAEALAERKFSGASLSGLGMRRADVLPSYTPAPEVERVVEPVEETPVYKRRQRPATRTQHLLRRNSRAAWKHERSNRGDQDDQTERRKRGRPRLNKPKIPKVRKPKVPKVPKVRKPKIVQVSVERAKNQRFKLWTDMVNYHFEQTEPAWLCLNRGFRLFNEYCNQYPVSYMKQKDESGGWVPSNLEPYTTKDWKKVDNGLLLSAGLGPIRIRELAPVLDIPYEELAQCKSNLVLDVLVLGQLVRYVLNNH